MNYTIKQFRQDFPDDNACLDYIFKARNYVCPCGSKVFYRVKSRKSYACKCGSQVNPLADTIFYKSSTKLIDWFFAIYLMSNAKNGVSAKELQRHLGITYKCAWRVGKQIRSLMKQDNSKLEGVVEADETYFGVKQGISGRGRDKTPVMGIVKRGGKIKTKVVPDTQTHTILNMLSDNVKFGSQLITDDYLVYRKASRIGLFHKSVNHSKKEYARGEAHTNTIEGCWSQLKRSIKGTYHCVSVKHLQSYVDQFAFQYNERFSDVPVFYSLLSRLCGQPDLGGQKMPSFVGVKVS